MRYSIYLFILFALLSQSCSTGKEKNTGIQNQVKIDDLGRKVTIPEKPVRIISLTPSITELLYTFVDTSRIVGRSVWCDYPEGVKKITAVNSYPIDVEAIVRLKPDLVLVKKGMISLTEITKLEQLHVPVFVQKYDVLNDIKVSIRTLVAITKGDSLKMEHWFTSLNVNHSSYLTRKKSIAIVSVSPIYVFGKATFVSELMTLAGGDNIVDIADNAYPSVDVEYIVRQNPEVFLFSSEEQKKLFFETYPVLKNCKGYKTDHLFVIDDSVLSRPGIRLPILKDSLISIMSR